MVPESPGSSLPVEGSTAASLEPTILREAEVARLRAMLDAIGYGARELGAASGDWLERVPPFLQRLGHATGVSRVSLFEAHDDAQGRLVESCRSDWAEEGLAPLTPDPRYQAMPLVDETGKLDDWARRRQRGEVVQATLSETSGYTRQVYEEQGTRSFISVPIHVDGQWWGFLGFDDCRHERRWSALELDVLRTAAALVAGSIARARADRRLQQSEERYMLAARGANDGLWDWDVASGRAYLSPRLCRILGLSRVAAGPRIDSLFGLLTPEAGGTLRDVMARCIAARQHKFEAECRVSRPGPAPSRAVAEWVVIRGLIVWQDGTPVRVVGGLRDISARKRIQIELLERTRELEHSRQLLRAVIDAVPAIVNVKDRESRYVLMNRFQGELYGVDPKAAIGHTSAEFTGATYGGHSRELDREVVESGRAQPFTEREFVDVQGRPHTWYTAKMPLLDDAGQVENIVTVALDISELKALERARADLTRYVAPAAAEVLASRSEPFGPPRSQDVAVLFADIVASSRLARSLRPAEFFALLREVHALLAAIVFEHHGALDKFIGDGIMATFGSPRPGPRDARAALACARAIQHRFWAWNAARVAAGAPPLRLAVGLHHGPALLGNIGDASRMEFAVLGDTVIVANRLEKLARPLDAGIVVSDALIEAARREAAAAGEAIDADLAALVPLGPQPLPDRDQAVAVWILPRAMPETGQ